MFRKSVISAACLSISGVALSQPAANDYQFRLKQLADIRLMELAVQKANADAIAALAGRMDASGAAAVGSQLAARSGSSSGAPQGVSAELPPPPVQAPECGFLCSTGKFVAGLADFTIRAGQVYAPIHAATASKAVQLASIASNEAVALGDQRARVDSLAVVSNGNASIAGSGFNALRGQGQDYASAFREALARPTTQVTVNGNGNNTSGRDTTTTTTTTTNTVDCVTNQTNRSGDPTSGNGGTNGAGGASTAAGATSTLAKECVAGK